jgi:hypothetical protein
MTSKLYPRWYQSKPVEFPVRHDVLRGCTYFDVCFLVSLFELAAFGCTSIV